VPFSEGFPRTVRPTDAGRGTSYRSQPRRELRISKIVKAHCPTVTRRLALKIIIAGVLSSSVEAAAQQQHWLIGTWTGSIEPEAIYHQYDTKTPAARTIVVTAVGADGNCIGTFSNPLRPIIAQITVEGDEVTIITSNQRGNRGLFGARTFHLHREGQILNGTLTFPQPRSSGGGVIPPTLHISFHRVS
jgi:hypothetical protein